MNNLQIINYNDQRVLTTAQLAESYGTESDRISKNFYENKERFKEGKHFFKLTGEELLHFRNSEPQIEVSNMTRTLYLWTEKGAWMHAKSLNTDQAWEAYEILVDEYYRVKGNAIKSIEALLFNPDTIIRIAENWKAEQALRIAAEKKIEADKPKVLFADSVTASKTSILIGDLAKILKQNGYETGQKRLFAQLRDEGYLIRRKGADYNMPTQKSMEMGLFEIKETVVTHSDGHISISKTPKITGKGQIYFINKYAGKVEAS